MVAGTLLNGGGQGGAAITAVISYWHCPAASGPVASAVITGAISVQAVMTRGRMHPGI